MSYLEKPQGTPVKTLDDGTEIVLRSDGRFVALVGSMVLSRAKLADLEREIAKRKPTDPSKALRVVDVSRRQPPNYDLKERDGQVLARFDKPSDQWRTESGDLVHAYRNFRPLTPELIERTNAFRRRFAELQSEWEAYVDGLPTVAPDADGNPSIRPPKG